MRATAPAAAGGRRSRRHGRSLPSWRLRRAATSCASRITLERAEPCRARSRRVPPSRQASNARALLARRGQAVPSVLHPPLQRAVELRCPPCGARGAPPRAVSDAPRASSRSRPAPCATPARGRSPGAPRAGREGRAARTPRARIPRAGQRRIVATLAAPRRAAPAGNAACASRKRSCASRRSRECTLARSTLRLLAVARPTRCAALSACCSCSISPRTRCRAVPEFGRPPRVAAGQRVGALASQALQPGALVRQLPLDLGGGVGARARVAVLALQACASPARRCPALARSPPDLRALARAAGPPAPAWRACPSPSAPRRSLCGVSSASPILRTTDRRCACPPAASPIGRRAPGRAERLVAARVRAPPERRHQQPLRPPAERLQVGQDREHREHGAQQEREHELGDDRPEQLRRPPAKQRPPAIAERRGEHHRGSQQQVQQAEDRRGEQPHARRIPAAAACRAGRRRSAAGLPGATSVPPSVRNSACAAVGPRQFVASLLWHSVRSSEPCSLIELRAGPFAGSARKIAPLLCASRSSSALCSSAFACALPRGTHGASADERGWQPTSARSCAAIFSPAARRRGSSRDGSRHQPTSPNSR